eukprot:scaffold226093_cov31-Tisochrysis_lutea.AAC.4
MSDKDLRECGLARAVRPHDGVHLALAHLKVDSLEDLPIRHICRQPIHLEHEVSGGHERGRGAGRVSVRCHAHAQPLGAAAQRRRREEGEPGARASARVHRERD